MKKLFKKTPFSPAVRMRLRSTIPIRKVGWPEKRWSIKLCRIIKLHGLRNINSDAGACRTSILSQTRHDFTIYITQSTYEIYL